MSLSKTIAAFLLVQLFFFGGTAEAKVIYVDADAAGASNGTNWTDAYTLLQDALAEAVSGDEVWVAEGTYYPDGGTGDRTRSFVVGNGVGVWGGFSGGEVGRFQRNWQSHLSILSGDIGIAGSGPDNAHHVVVAEGGRLDGLVIEGGYAWHGTNSADDLYNYGGAVFVTGNTSIVNCWIRNNFAKWGAGVATNWMTSQRVIVVSTRFESNSASMNGAALRLTGYLAYPNMIQNCSFVANSGVTLFTYGADTRIANCTFRDNVAGLGVIRVEGTDWHTHVDVVNSVIFGNSSNSADYVQLYQDYSGAIDFHITYSDLESGAGSIRTYGGGNLGIVSATYGSGMTSSTPTFQSATNERLAAGSAGVDAGDNAGACPGSGLGPPPPFDASALADVADLDGDGDVAETLPFDLDGHRRIVNDPDSSPATATVDMGAYERSRVMHVDHSATGSNDGTSWGNAFVSLQSALLEADATAWPDEIWVAHGTYYPTDIGDANRGASFDMRGNVGIYGGFLGNESAREQRDWQRYETTLSGDIGTAGDAADNSYHVVTAMTGYGANSTSRLDGFTITGGRADGTPQNYGGGLVTNSSPRVVNCTFRANLAAQKGGAVFADAAAAGTQSPQFLNCRFFDNYAFYGGALYNSFIAPDLTNYLLSGNSGYWGGAVYNGSGANARFFNCTVIDNDAVNYGGGINNVGQTGPVAVSLYNTILWGNTAPNGPQIALAGASAVNDASLIADACDLEGGTGAISREGTWSWGTNNIQTMDPLLLAGSALPTLGLSPVIDAGDSGLLPADVADLDGDGNISEALPLDLGGRQRVAFADVDLGAYEVSSTFKLHVDDDATPGGDGSSWATAFNHLQDALAAARPGDEIWVAEGTYKPDRSAIVPAGDRDRLASFRLQTGVALYGGFGGFETVRTGRNWLTYPTVLSGDLAGDDEPSFTNTTENVYHVLDGSGTDTSAVLDGFIITAGNADATYHPLNKGGGLYNSSGGSPTVSNCTFSGNSAAGHRGGGMWNGGGSNPLVSDCQFIGNRAVDGAGMANESSSPFVVRCTFENNTASGNGGGIYNLGTCSPVVSETVFSGNTAQSGAGYYERQGAASTILNGLFYENAATYGGGYYGVFDCVSVCTNCTFADNSASSIAGALRIYTNSSMTVTNSIVWGNSAPNGPQIGLWSTSTLNISYSDLEGGQAAIYKDAGSAVAWGAGNIDSDPLFAGAGDYHLTPFSPCVEAGTNSAPDIPPTDFEGDPRTYDADGDGTAVADIGADELASAIPSLPDLVVTGIVTEPASPRAGDPVTVTVTVLNQGAGGAGAFYVDFYKDRSTAPPPGTWGDFACHTGGGGLAAGATFQCSGSVGYPTAGTYSMYAQVDADQIVTETDENNVFGPQDILVQPPLPDLVVTGITTDPTSPVAGDSLSVTVTVLNQGLGDAGSFYVDFYKDRTAPPGLGDYGDMWCLVTSLLAGTTYECVLSVSYAEAGEFDIYAQADTDSEVIETNEDNNIFGSQGIVVQPAPVLITVATSPAGLQIEVDGSSYASPQTFSWLPGSTHDIEVPSPQNAGTGTRHVLTSWSDGGAQSHEITTPSADTTYTASFVTQYSLTTAVTPEGAGTVEPDCAAGCWYDSAAWVTLSATPAAGYAFSMWSGNVGSPLNPADVPMVGALSVTGNFTPGNQPPTLGALTPSDLSSPPDASRSLEAVYSDANGFSDLKRVFLHVNETNSGANGIYVMYDRPANQLYLYNDAGNGYVGSCAPGAAESLSNSQGTLDCAATSAAGAGSHLTVDWNITPTADFASTTPKNVYLYAYDLSPTPTGWADKGNWRISDVNAVPTLGTLTPTRITSPPGEARSFTAVYRDANGAADLKRAFLRVNTTNSGANAVYAMYDVPTNRLYLYNDAGTAYVDSCALGVPGSLGNTQGTVDCAGTSVAASGSNLTVVWSVTPKAAFASATASKNIYLYAYDMASASTGWADKGDWTIMASNSRPTLVSVTPPVSASPPGTAQSLSTVYRDADGHENLKRVFLRVNGTNSRLNGIYLMYDRPANVLYLFNDAGTGYAGSCAPGATGVLSNSQGSLDCALTTTAGSGDDLTVSWSITPNAAFASTTAKNLYLYAYDISVQAVGWADKGDWTITP